MRRALLLVLSVLLVAMPAPARAGDDPTGQREETRDRQREVAVELDTLTASDVELSAAVDRLEAERAEQRDVLAEARRAQAAAEREVEMLLVDVRRAEAAVAEREMLVAERAVIAYMHPHRAELVALLGSRDYNELHRRDTFIGQVADHDQRLLDELRAAKEELDGRRVAAQEAEARAEGHQSDAQAALTRLDEARQEQEAVQVALHGRIADIRAESDALLAQEAELTALIDQRAAEARRQAEEEARRATATTAAPTGRGGAPPSTAPAPSPSRPPSGGGGGTSLTWPVSGPVTSEFGLRWGRMHNGIDIGAASGTPIRAAGSGTVFFVGWMNGYGNTVLVDHGGGLTTLYAHQSSLAASAGRSVGRGEVVGYVGSTGQSTAPHLHFETRVDGSARNPRQYLP